MALKKVEKISAVDQVCDCIKQSIADGTLLPGEKLMSEGQMSEAFGVNRFTVRLALQKLSTLGLIETKVGEGSFVKQASMKQYVKEMKMFWDEDVKEEDIARLRYLIENDSTILAVSCATEEECEELKRLLDCYSNELDRALSGDGEADVDKLVKADMAFHTQIVVMSHNPLYAEVYTIVKELVREHIKRHLAAVCENTRKGLDAPADTIHRPSYEAIVNRDMEAAKRLKPYRFD